MRILLLTAYFPPEIGAASHLFFDLGKGLVKKRYSVQVLTGLPSYNLEKKPKRYRRKILVKEKMDGMEVIRIGVTHLPSSRSIPILRGLEHFWMATVFSFAQVFLKKPDLILFYSPPITLGLSCWFLGRLKQVPFIVNVQDLFPQNAIDLGILKNSFLIKIFQKIERFVYKKANFVTVHSNQNKKYILNKGIPEEKIEVVPNWVDTGAIKPGKRMNAFREKYKLGNRFIVSFAGVLGYSQDFDVILDAANFLKRDDNILFLIVGEGPEKTRIQKKAEKMKLENVKFLPMQPRQDYPLVLAGSDVCLVTLRKEVKTPVVPSKILSIMAAGRPIAAAMDLAGDGPEIIRKARCGFVLSAGDGRKLADSILKLYQSVELREKYGYNGRRYCEKYLSLRSGVRKYMGLFSKLK